MSRFLNIVENNLPIPSDDKLNSVVDKLADLLNTISEIDVVSAASPEELTVSINGNIITLTVKDIKEGYSEEDAEMAMSADYQIDSKIADMASRAKSGAVFGRFGSAAAKAKSAQDRRDKVVTKAIPIYDKVTKDLESALSKITATTTTNITQ
jgi:hypothetical protein